MFRVHSFLPVHTFREVHTLREVHTFREGAAAAAVHVVEKADMPLPSLRKVPLVEGAHPSPCAHPQGSAQEQGGAHPQGGAHLREVLGCTHTLREVRVHTHPQGGVVARANLTCTCFA